MAHVRVPGVRCSTNRYCECQLRPTSAIALIVEHPLVRMCLCMQTACNGCFGIAGGSRRADQPGLKEIELGPPVRWRSTSLRIGFLLTIGPRLRNRRVDRGLVVGNAGRERGDQGSAWTWPT